MMRTKFPVSWISVLALCATAAWGAAGGEKITFKPLNLAILKMDGKQVKTWDVFRAEKRQQFVLVQIGSRNLLLDLKAKQIFELAPAALAKKGRELHWEAPESTTSENKKLLPTEDWTAHSAGPALIIQVRLSAEGRVLEVQLPQQPDMRPFY